MRECGGDRWFFPPRLLEDVTYVRTKVEMDDLLDTSVRHDVRRPTAFLVFVSQFPIVPRALIPHSHRASCFSLRSTINTLDGNLQIDQRGLPKRR
jgi:hypothetical protein